MDRMTMNDICDEIFNSRLPYWSTCAPPRRYIEPTCECGAPLESGDDSHCKDCS